ncbi:MAG: hypothetical protein M1817_000369 [Caeruleum heppii]|nr:MAG: hypothetical protein M1817_000369 [Caeruleum heppii]
MSERSVPSAPNLDTELAGGVPRGAPSRPCLTHLNADSSWLLQLPIPRPPQDARSGDYFNILIDPWFTGSQVDVAPWFSRQWHAIESKVKTISDVEGLIATRGNPFVGSAQASSDEAQDTTKSRSCIDVVIISHEFTDHCHRETLLELSPEVPIFAAKKAASLIRSWAHFSLVQTIPSFDEANAGWTRTSLAPLPRWLGVGRLTSSNLDPSCLHSAVIISFDVGDGAEAIIYTPHGISPRALEPLATADPPLNTLALIHGLHEVSLGGVSQINLGAHNGLKGQRQTQAKYWVRTHDEIKTGKGLIGAILKRNALTVDDALKEEKAERDERAQQEVNFYSLDSGESLVLV